MLDCMPPHRRIQDFFRGRLKDEFIRMCTDCTAVKTQLLMVLFLTNTVITIHVLAKSHSHHYPGPRRTGTFPEQKPPSKQFRNYSQTYLTLKSKLLNVGKVLLLAKQTQDYAEKTRGSGIEVTQIYTEKPEMPPVTFVGNLCKIHHLLFSKIADVHGIEVHDDRT